MKDKVILLSSEAIGKGDEELGKKVMPNFLGTLIEKQKLPHAIFMVNSAVKLATREADVADAMTNLEKSGVRILACLTCVRHYKLEGEIEPHRVSSMST